MSRKVEKPVPKQEVTPEVVAEAPAERAKTKTELVLERAELITSLSAVVKSDEVRKVLLAQPSGSKVYQLFLDAVSKEMAIIMEGKDQQTEMAAANLHRQMDAMANGLSKFNVAMASMMEGQLLSVLMHLAKRLTPGAQPEQSPEQPYLAGEPLEPLRPTEQVNSARQALSF
jgi:hypothetical protein